MAGLYDHCNAQSLTIIVEERLQYLSHCQLFREVSSLWNELINKEN
jgi:hypothetical protein